ncbi:hypothetical protein BH23GEM11_BH23GEM11_08760 [soil metagenome]
MSTERPGNGTAPPRWDPGTATARRNGSGRIPEDVIDEGVSRLRTDAVTAARADAEIGVPSADRDEPSESEFELKERCRAFLQRLRNMEHRQVAREVDELEERVTDALPKAALHMDRYERVTNDMTRLRLRRTTRRREMTEELRGSSTTPQRGIPTPVYLVAIAFLGMVEFFANAPVFSALLPRDTITERQLRLLSETSEGMFAGIERVFAHIFLKPDAALLAAGVIVFLCVLAHFFGHSLRELVIQWDPRSRKDRVATRSALESAVPMVITGIGLALTLTVLFEARVMLGSVGEERYAQDTALVEELRREAGWLRADGNLVEANQLENRAVDTEEVAGELREYSASMARMSFPILLLNLTLVLCAIAAAYFHKQDARVEKFNEDVFEEDRKALVSQAEELAEQINVLLAELMRDIRRLRSAVTVDSGAEWRAVVPQLEAVVALYRAENGRARGMESRAIPEFRKPIRLDTELEADGGGGLQERAPNELERERQTMQARFDELRKRYNEEARA